MKKEAVQAFTARITQASKSDLTVILYEMILTQINEAKSAFENNDLQSFQKELKYAQKYVNELMATLNYQYAISYELLSLYLYVNKTIIKAIMKKDAETLSTAETVMEKLFVGFEGVSKTDHSGPLMQNTQQLYAGLTYGKGKLNETFVDQTNNSRGFIA